MKTIMLSLLLWGFAGTALAVERADLDDRIRVLTTKLESLQEKPDKAIPADTLRKAQGIILLDRVKAGFLFAYQGGSGVSLVRDAATKAWSPVAFVGASEASLGFQAGGEENFIVILLMDTNALRMLTDRTFEVGAEARGTAGDKSGAAPNATAEADKSVLIYDDRQGLYGGAVIKSDAIAPDESANHIYYGQPVTVREILFDHKVPMSETAATLVKKIDWQSQSHDSFKTVRK